MAAAAETTVARVANPAEQAMLAVAYATMEGNEARNESVEVITRELATFPARFQSVMDRIELMSEQMAALKEENAALRGRCEALESSQRAQHELQQAQHEKVCAEIKKASAKQANDIHRLARLTVSDAGIIYVGHAGNHIGHMPVSYVLEHFPPAE